MYMKKKTMSVLLIVILISSSILSGCGKKYENGELNLFMWTEYIPQSVIDGFEKEYGIKVNMQTYSGNEEMLAKVQKSNPGTYDIVCPSDYMVENMIKDNMLLELNKDDFENIGNLDETYLNPSYDPDNKYSIPYLGGAAAIVYNKTMVDPSDDMTDYATLYKPTYKNSIVMLNDFRAIVGVASLSIGNDFNETDTTKLDQAKQKLLELKPNIKSLDSDSPKTMMITGETAIGVIWSGESALAMKDNKDLDIAFPKQGMYLFFDNLCILKDSKNSENAKKFIDYVLRADVNKEISTEFPYLNPNKAGVALMDDDYKNNKAICIPSEEIKKGSYVKNIGKTVDLYNEIWAEFTK